MSDFNGFANISMKDVALDEMPAFKDTLGVGRHTVVIENAKVENENGKHTLVLSYENEKGQCRQWLDIVDKAHPQSVEINWKIIKKLLLLLGHEGEDTPDVSFFNGKTIGINIKNKPYNGKDQFRVNYHFVPNQPAKIAASTMQAPQAPPAINDQIPF